MAERENKYECPNCHSEYIQRFEVVYEGGMSDLSLTTFGVGLGDDLGVGVGGSGGISQTMLSEEVAPPLQRSVAEPALLFFVKHFSPFSSFHIPIVIMGNSSLSAGLVRIQIPQLRPAA